MALERYQPDGKRIAASDLTIDRANQVAAALTWYPHASLIEVWRDADGEKIQEYLIVALDVELPQDTDHDIRPEEELILGFATVDDTCPTVESCRRDFPRVPHLYRTREDKPKSLCIYDDPWSEVRLGWTAASFLADIARWLAKTAVGELHQEDQPLEPFLLGGIHTLILPTDLFDEANRGSIYVATETEPIESGPMTLQLHPVSDKAELGNVRKIFCIVAQGEPAPLAAMHDAPSDLIQLIALFEHAGVDLYELLVEEINNIYECEAKPETNAGLLVVLQLPRVRKLGGPIERIETWAFAMESIQAVAISTGRYAKAKSGPGIVPLIVPQRNDAELQSIDIEPVRTVHDIDRATARIYSGLDPSEKEHEVVLVGGGAIGSQVHSILSRMGWGRWSIVDNDTLYPHNVVRHRLGHHAIGYRKVVALSHTARIETPFNVLEAEYPQDIFEVASHDKLAAQLRNADIIVDASASIAVARFVARSVEGPARRVSMFLNPSGTDVVFLAEDVDRVMTMDALEAQYYEAILNDARLEHHIRAANTTRYSAGCRDITARIGQDYVATASGILAKQLRSLPDSATASVWRMLDEGSIAKTAIPLSPVVEHHDGGWQILVSANVVQKADRLRAARLPTETGGVMVGYFDIPRESLYVVDVLPAPPDSIEHSAAFIRGYSGLQAQMKQITERTGGQVAYVGEWHSHPDGAGLGMSDDDKELLATIADDMRVDGRPGVIMIVGSATQVRFHVMDAAER